MLRMRAVAVILALLSPAVFGLGLGSLKTKSALNEPFLGRIEIVDAKPQDFDAMTARLADAAQFQRAGVAREAVLLNLHFEVVSSESGADYLKITTKEPVREPFLNFLLELNWAKGRLVREYTVLLDPPLYDRNKVNRPSVAPPSAAPQKLTAPAARAATPGSAPTPRAAPATASDTIGPVQARDTAWRLALAHRPDSSISVQQMMLAMLRSNPSAFANSNVNVLRRGAILRMPTAAEIQGISQAEALAEIKHQHEVWEGYRQASAKHVEEAPVSAPAPTAITPPPATASESTPTTPTSTPKTDAHLELAAPETKSPSAAESPNPPTTEKGSKAGADTSALSNEALDAKTRESVDLQSKLTEAEQIIDLLQRQVKIKDDELAKLQSKVSTPPPPTTPSTTAGKPTPTPTASTPVPTSAIAPSPETNDGLLSRLMGFIPAQIRDAVPGGAMTILGILASLLILVAFGVVRAAGSGGKAIVASAPKVSTVAAVAAVAAATKSVPAAQDQMLSTAQDVPAYDPSGDQEQFMRTMEASSDQLTGTPQEDPLEEVNVYLAYERFDQAEELVKQVIAEHPNEPKYKLRLLEIYYSANNKRAYENAARELRDAVGEQSPLWESAVAMWNEMSPGRALFAPGADIEPETSVAAAGAKSFVDITSATAATTLTLAPGGDPLASTVVSATDDIDSGGLDFDLSETTAQVTPAPSVLDITAGEGPKDGILDLTATADDAGLNQLLDSGSTLASTHGGTGDVFDISGGLPDTLELGQDGATHDIDLLDVTDAGDGLSLGEVGLLDVTSPRSERTISSTDAAEAITVNALDNRGDLDEFDLGDTVAPAVHGGTSGDELDFDIAALERSVHQATSNDLDDFDLTLDSDLDASSADAAKADLELSLNTLSQFDLDSADSSSGTGESDVEFDLALQDTTDFENLAINDTLEIPKSVIASRGMQAIDTPSESLEDLTRSMEASIAGLSLKDIHGDDDSILDLALEPDSDSIDLDFGLDDGMGLNELDTLALDPGELRKAEGTISERTVSLSRDGTEHDLHATMDETDTKLNLAKAYIELGDHDGARSILNEVVADGQTEQQDEARKLLSQLT